MSKKKQKKRAKQGDGQVITTANPLYGVARLFESKTRGEIRKNIKDAKEYGRKLCIVTNTDLSNNETGSTFTLKRWTRKPTVITCIRFEHYLVSNG